jgi:cytochrome c oxidase assembly protein subunit 11
MGQSTSRSNKKVALMAAALAMSMIGVAYAAVPLYRIFCQITGYGGTTQVSENASEVILSKTINVRFDGNISRNLGWSFKPVKREITLKIGETRLAYYKAKNLGNTRTTGTATFNVTPAAAGQYFNKVACFCFTKQTLEPGESVDMPVSFFIDPEIVNDKNLDEVTTITLSYTFFPLKTNENTETSNLADKSKNNG